MTAAERLAIAIAGLRSGNGIQVSKALDQFAVLDPVPERREELAGLIAEYLADPDPWQRSRACKALLHWQTPAMVPKLIKCTEDPERFVRSAAVEALSYVKGSKEAAAAVAARLKDDHMSALPAIKRMGPIAEDAVLAELGRADGWEIDRCLDALEAVGTVKSLEKLRPYIHSKNFFIRIHVQSTVRAIQMRRATK